MGLIIQDNGCVLCFLDFSKLKLDVKGRLIISESSGYHCIHRKKSAKRIIFLRKSFVLEVDWKMLFSISKLHKNILIHIRDRAKHL